MSKNPLILTIDYGTQSCRVSLFNKKGDVIALEKEIYDPVYFSKKPGYAEQDPDSYYASFTKAAKRLCDGHKDLIKDVIGVVQTCFRDSAVMLDKDLKVVRPMVLWLDQRFAKCDYKMPLFNETVCRLIGMYDVLNMNRKRTVANWMKENEKENWDKTAKYVPVSAYFNYKMTGELSDSSASIPGHYPMDFKHRTWYKNVKTHFQACIFGIRQDQLCKITPEGEIIGYISKKTYEETGIPAGLPLYATGSDKSCETLGQGIIDDKKASISLGTASTIETTIRKFKTHDGFFPSYPSCLPGYFNMDVQVYRGFWMINWFLKEFGAVQIDDLVTNEVNADKFNAQLKDVPAGSDGLILQPYWGSMLERPLVKGAMVGFTDATTRNHVYRALIEGIFYCLREAGEGFEKKLKTKFNEIRISGGGAKSDEICQICSDVFGIEVKRVQTNEASSLGAAIAGFVATKEFSNPKEAVASMVRVVDTFKPNMENHAVYDHYFYDVYKKLYPSLKKTYAAIWKSTRR